MAVKRNYRINLRNYGNPPAIMVSQYDENYDLVFEVYDGVVPATGLNAYTVKLVGRQPGNDPALKYEFTGTVSGIANNILSFTIDTTMTGRAGKGTAEIVILDTTNDVKFASFNLPVYVEKAAVPDDAIDADVERAQEIADQIEELIDGATEGAEAWAVGQRGGVDVESTDPTYHNNAKYYAEQAQDIADSIGIDATLSISGKAADAKKTGDEISSLKEDLSINDPPTVTWQIGGFNSNGAINSTNLYAVRNSGGAAIAITKDGTIGCASGYRIKVVKYSGIVMGAGTCLSNSGWVTTPIAVSAGDYVGISIMYGTDTSVVLDDTSISANVILTFRTLKIADNSIAQAKLTTDIQSLLADTASALPQVASNTSDIATIAEWVDLPTNIAYVTDGVSATHYGVTYAKSANNALSLYGTSSGLGFFNVFNGADGYGNSGSSTPAKNLTAGTYIVDFDGAESNKLEVCYTDSTYSNRTVLRSGQILVVADGGGAIFARIYGSKNFGTEESPTILKLSMRNVSYNHGPYNIYGRDFSDWYSGLNGDYSSYGFGWGTKYADVIALYDALVTAYPDYITKTALGQGSGTDSQGNAYYLYEYAFVPKIKTSGLNSRKIPKILMDACIHGFEKNSALGLFCFLKDVCDQWENNKSLEYLRHFVEIRVIPVSCPWGFDNNDRRNYNGVNLNRNFPCAGWEAGEESGVAPLDQAESAIIADWIKENADMLYYLNLHTNGQYNAAGWSEANYCMSSNDRNDDYFNRIYTVFSKHITQQTYEFAKMYDLDFGSAFFGTIHTEASTESGKGTIQIYCHTYLGNVMGMTLESFNGVTVGGESVITVLSPQSTKMCSEIIGNMVIQILGEYGE